jgi:hypothetical protein
MGVEFTGRGGIIDVLGPPGWAGGMTRHYVDPADGVPAGHL